MELVEKFMNDNFVVTHNCNASTGMHEVITYNHNKGEFIGKYETEDERYAHLSFIQYMMLFLN